MNLLVFSEVDEIARELLSGLRILGGKKTLFTYSKSDFKGFADKVVRASIPDDSRIEDHAVSALSALARGFDLIVIGATKRGEEIAPRVAQRLDLPCVTGVIGIHPASLEVERYFLSGRTVARERILSFPAVVSIMPRTFEIMEGDEIPEVEEMEVEETGKISVVARRKKEKHGIELEKAGIIVGVGRGIRGKDGIEKAMELKEVLGAEIGSTRPVAYDYGWLPEETMIGLSGKRTKPELYIAIGISGQIQHMMGVMQAKRIVAVNSDENAPIFEYADYGIVGEWREVLPILIGELKK